MMMMMMMMMMIQQRRSVSCTSLERTNRKVHCTKASRPRGKRGKPSPSDTGKRGGSGGERTTFAGVINIIAPVKEQHHRNFGLKGMRQKKEAEFPCFRGSGETRRERRESTSKGKKRGTAEEVGDAVASRCRAKEAGFGAFTKPATRAPGVTDRPQERGEDRARKDGSNLIKKQNKGIDARGLDVGKTTRKPLQEQNRGRVLIQGDKELLSASLKLTSAEWRSMDEQHGLVVVDEILGDAGKPQGMIPPIHCTLAIALEALDEFQASGECR